MSTLLIGYEAVIIVYSIPGETPGVFDHTVVNDRLDEAYQHLKDVVLKVCGVNLW